jgi:hypothetical protein
MNAILARALSIRNLIWAASSYFILAACFVFLLHQRYEVSWGLTVLALGCLTALVALILELVIAAPLERMAASVRAGDAGGAAAMPKPTGVTVPHELRQLWRSQQGVFEQSAHLRLLKEGLEARLMALDAEARLLRGANSLLAAPEGSLEQVTSLLDDLTGVLEVESVWLVPLRRQAPWPVVGAQGIPAWAHALRPRSSAVWGELLAAASASLFCLAPQHAGEELPFARRTLALFPLFHRGRPQGFLLVVPHAETPAWPPSAWGLVGHLAPALAAALYPYRWPDGRRIVTPERDSLQPGLFEAVGEV